MKFSYLAPSHVYTRIKVLLLLVLQSIVLYFERLWMIDLIFYSHATKEAAGHTLVCVTIHNVWVWNKCIVVHLPIRECECETNLVVHLLRKTTEKAEVTNTVGCVFVWRSNTYACSILALGACRWGYYHYTHHSRWWGTLISGSIRMESSHSWAVAWERSSTSSGGKP